MLRERVKRTAEGDWLEGLEGVGPATAAKLRELGVASLEHLAEFTVEELVEAGIEYDRAVRILQQARARVAAGLRQATAADLLRQEPRVFKTGVAEFDGKTPWRGVREAFIYEFAGEYGAGKSMLAHQLCVAAVAQGFTPACVYVDTEGTFSPALAEAVRRRFGGPEDLLSRIHVVQPANASFLEHFVKLELPRFLAQGVRLLVIDTITALYRAEFVGREMLAARQQRIHYLVDWLRRHARVFGLTSVLTNQVMDVPEAFSVTKRPAGGNVLAHAVNARFMMVRPSKQKAEGYMWPLDVPGMPPEVRMEYRITEAGLE